MAEWPRDADQHRLEEQLRDQRILEIERELKKHADELAVLQQLRIRSLSDDERDAFPNVLRWGIEELRVIAKRQVSLGLAVAGAGAIGSIFGALSQFIVNIASQHH